jgi:hypothetical protein
MAAVVDNLIAYRVLSMLVKPFVETDAYKLGIIDEKGTNLIRSRDFTSSEQKDAYTYLHRLVFNLKRLLGKLPGGDSKLKNIVAAFYLVKEAYSERRVNIDERDLEAMIKLLDDGLTLVEEQLVVEEFLLCEEGEGGAPAPTSGPANVTGSRVSTDIPVIRRKPKRFARFTVNDELYNKFSNGKAKFRKWASYLNLEHDGERVIYEFARKNPNAVIILHNSKNSRAIRFNRRGGGNWNKIKRSSKG